MAGSGVVSRWAKETGFEVVSNDWEPYTAAINGCYVACSAPPLYAGRRSYEQVVAELNALAPVDGWVTRHLCPRDDANPDLEHERMFYMRKNGQRIDAIRCRIAEWDAAGELSDAQRCCLLAPLLYQACYTSNTSGVFKGFHRGWGGQTRHGALSHRVRSAAPRRRVLRQRPPQPGASGRMPPISRPHRASSAPSMSCISTLRTTSIPYGSNYHVLNTVTLWDHPVLEPTITRRGDKSAIRQDWRARRSRLQPAGRGPGGARAPAGGVRCPVDRDQLQHRWQHRPAGTCCAPRSSVATRRCFCDRTSATVSARSGSPGVP